MEGNNLIWLVLLLPLLGAGIQAVLSLIAKDQPTRGSKKLAGLLAVVPIAIAFALGVAITQRVVPGVPVTATAFPWIEISGFSVPFELRIDSLSMTMVLIITGIGTLIHIYATGYMADEKDFSRFFSYLNLFIAAMLMLVLGNNLLLLFIGWEGVGLCSYLLIGFWYKDLANSRAANKAFVVNRIGDWGLTLGLFLIVAAVATTPGAVAESETRLLSYDVILKALPTVFMASPGVITAIALLLFVGACGKSAQFPLYIWLPDAMAGPTPVSALIHAATMVTSGVFLLNRMHVVYELSPVAAVVVCAVGALTALIGAVIAFGQTDIKKVLAYSTVSQLGFMFVACGVGASWVGMFHVTTHAFFKALLFLGSGAVIHAMMHEQDMRHYGRLAKYIPITFLTMAIGWLAISGIPGLSGFYSKEAVIGAALAGNHAKIGEVNVGIVAGWTCLGVALLTAMYMTRMMMLTFFSGAERWRSLSNAQHGHDESSESDQDHHKLTGAHKPHEAPLSMTLPLIILAVLSLGGGYVLASGNRFENWLGGESRTMLEAAELHPTGIPLVALSVGAAVLGIVAAIISYFKELPSGEAWDETKWSSLRLRMRAQFGFDELMMNTAIDGGATIANSLDKDVDRGLLDTGGAGAGEFTRVLAGILKTIQTGYVRMYAMVMLAGVVGVLAWVLFAVNGGKH